jgi:hypothetical protein
MAKYKVVHMQIIHGAPDAEKAETYEPGNIIELTEEEALRLGNNVIQVSDESPETMTVEQLKADLINFYDASQLKNLKKAELVNTWINVRNDLKTLAG